MPHYREYYRKEIYTDREVVLPAVPENEEDTVAVEPDMANKSIHDFKMKIHIQKLFDMDEIEYTCLHIKNLLSENIYGDQTFLAFDWTKFEDRNDDLVVNEDVFDGRPIILIKIFMAAQLWLKSEVLFPYLVSIGRQNPMYRQHSFMLMNPKETGDNEKSFGRPGYYRSTIGSLTNIFAVLQYISDNWNDCSSQMKQWATLVLIYGAMHFIQEGSKLLESRSEQQMWLNCRNKMLNDMTRAQGDLLGECLHLDEFVAIVAFMITNISPIMTFLKDTSTDYQVFTRPSTGDELRFNNELRLIESRLPVRGVNANQMVESNTGIYSSATVHRCGRDVHSR